MDRIARNDRALGYTAYKAGKPFDAHQNIDWQNGWEDAASDAKANWEY